MPSINNFWLLVNLGGKMVNLNVHVALVVRMSLRSSADLVTHAGP